MVDGITSSYTSHYEEGTQEAVPKDDKTTIKKNTNFTKRKKKKRRNRKKQSGDVVVTKCNKIIINIKPVITKDSRHIICACGNIVAVFRRKTGLLEKSFTEHKLNVTNLYINQQDPSQVISCSPREFIIWDYDDMSVAKKYVFPFVATAWYITPKSYEDVYYKGIHGNTGKKSSNKEQLIKWNITGSCEPIPLGKTSKSTKSVAVSINGEYVVYTYKNELSIYTCADEKKNSFTFDHVQLTCVALHPTELIVGTGDKVGKIILWYNLVGQGKHVCSQLHWHNSMVTDMLFTNDGNYIMSGGNEGVLVMWQLETQNRSFTPRVGGAIQHLVQSFDDQYVALSVDNNMIKIVSTVSTELMKTIKFLAQAYELPAGLSYHSPMGCLVLNGKPDGVLQFYQPREDGVKLSIDIIGENLVSSVVGRYVYPTRVKHIAFSDDGNWMATVEEREDRILPTERKLKFWKYEDKNYSLNTLVDPPHRDEITSLCFRPSGESKEYGYIAVTTSKDGDIKMWELTDEADNKGNVTETWQIHSASNYGMKSCHCACFSEDGTILAVLFSAVTLWDPDNLTFKRCLQFNAKDDAIKAISFAHNESSHFLIGRSAKYLIVWDIRNTIECSIAWMLKLSVHLITCDPYSKYFAAFVGSEEKTMMDLYLFDAASRSPVAIHHQVNRGHAHTGISSAIFTPKKHNGGGKTVWAKTGQLYILTENTEVLAVQEDSAEKNEGPNQAVTSKESDTTSAFEDIFGATLAEDEKDEDDDDEGEDGGGGERRIPVGNPSAVVIRKMISTPAHALPSTDVLCKAYMKSLLIRNPDSREEEEEDDENDMETEESPSSAFVEKQENHEPTTPNGDHHENTKNMATVCSGDDVMATEKNYTPSDELLEKVSKWNFDFIVYPYESH